jgi:hypothetical protein
MWTSIVPRWAGGKPVRSMSCATYGIFLGFIFFLLWLLTPKLTTYEIPDWINRYANIDAFDRRRHQILVVESQGYHEEVYAAFLQALSRTWKAETTIQIWRPRFSMNQITEQYNWYNAPNRLPYGRINQTSLKEIDPDIIITATCGGDLNQHEEVYRHVLENTKAMLYCVVHHADMLNPKTPSLMPLYIAKNRIRIIVLSEHVKISMLREFKDSAPFSVFPPVFEPDLNLVVDSKEDYFAVQGNLNHRKLDEIFSMLEKQRNAVKISNDMLAPPPVYLIGGGVRPNVSSKITDLVCFKQDLSYPDFYATLAGAVALMPAFLYDKYYSNSVSSTVGAAVIAGVPLVASQRMLDCYTYLDSASVVFKKDEETEFEAAMRFLALSPLLRSRTAASMLDLRRRVIRQNRLNLGMWISQDLSRNQGERV